MTCNHKSNLSPDENGFSNEEKLRGKKKQT